jgi:hypothetical protein
VMPDRCSAHPGLAVAQNLLPSLLRVLSRHRSFALSAQRQRLAAGATAMIAQGVHLSAAAHG